MTKIKAILVGLTLTVMIVGVMVISGKTYSYTSASFENVNVTACKVEDADGNLATTDDHTAIEDWWVYLSINSERQEPGQQTGEDGCYTWTNLIPGVSYAVEEDVPSNWFNLTPTSHDFGLAMSGETYSYKFVNSEYASTSGYKWIDWIPDGGWDHANEPPMPGWTIELWDVTGAPVPVASTTTDGNGYYAFTNFEPGKTYAVCELLDFAYLQTFPSEATPDPDPPKEVIFDCTVLGANYGPYGYQFVALSGEEFTDNYFGNVEPMGCTYTQGYWKTHSIYGPASKPDDGWYTSWGIFAPGLDGPNAQLFDAQYQDKNGNWYDMTWLDAFNHPPGKDNAWFILAHQWMTAYLNFYNGAGKGGVEVMQWISDGAALLDAWDQYDNGAPLIPKDDPARESAIELAGWLDMYNSGYWGPGPCDF